MKSFQNSFQNRFKIVSLLLFEQKNFSNVLNNVAKNVIAKGKMKESRQANVSVNISIQPGSVIFGMTLFRFFRKIFATV